MTTNNEFPKKYNPKDFEKKLYDNWEEKGLFKPRESTTGENFYIPMPPPNVTAKLHVGHSLTSTIEDIMTRYHRMKWDSTLLLPWTDHAGISTQVKVEQKLALEWKTKHNISREEFLKECWDWTEKYGWEIKNQFREMWTSCDWSKEKFTMDDNMNKKVNQAFVKLYEKWLIYKWEYMVNYDSVLDTVISDQEVVYKEEKGHLYHITYFVSWSDTEIIIATTRPETLLWDVAVAVHPKDKRYKKLLKAEKKLILPIVNKEIPLIADEMVDMNFWTWAVKITPAHDPNDFQTAKRHWLPLDEIVLGKDWKMTKKAWIFAGQNYKIARNNIVELLKAKWNLTKVEDYISKVAYWERSHSKIETIISTQWFVKIEPLAKKVIRWYKKKEFEIIPKKFEKMFEDWIFNLRDWCISRQLIWGHRIPVWYDETGKMFCAENEKQAQEKAWKWVKLTRDSDALDTWFSSALWPFAVLDYDMDSDKQPDLVKQFYPASVLETGHDIIFFWVIRMLLFWYEFTNQAPFKKIYFHGLVRDKLGRKMSKSLWNWVEPLEMIEKYWTDALRLTLVIWNTPWNDLKFDEENVKNNSIFINKLWNASRFVSMKITTTLSPESSLPDGEKGTTKKFDIEKIEKNLIKNYDELMLHEKWILSRIKYLSDEVTSWMENYNFSSIWQELQIFTKNEFCDYYIEEFKLTDQTSKFWKEVITYVLNKLLKLWHPYIPFVTEEIYSKIWFSWDLIIEEYAKINIERNIEVEKAKNLIIELIKEIRKLRVEKDIKPNKTIKLQIYAKNKNAEIIAEVIDLLWDIVKSEETLLVDVKPKDDNLAYSIIKKWVEVYVDTSNAIDKDKEIARIKEQLEDTKTYIKIIDKKLLNPNFVQNAPDSLVRAEISKKDDAKNKLEKLEEKLGKLK